MSEGRWVENNARWFEMQMRYCALCGQVIAGRRWEVEIEGSPQTFCQPACEALYLSYLMKQTDAATTKPSPRDAPTSSFSPAIASS
jgi:ribosome-binding protein aMBF1 (putative translation factor)